MRDHILSNLVYYIPATVCLYIVLAGVVHGVVRRNCILDGEDSIPFAIFWAITVPVSSVYIGIRWFTSFVSRLTQGKIEFSRLRNWLDKRKVARKKRAEAKAAEVKARAEAARVRIEWPERIDTVEQYRKLAGVVRKFERTMPVMEREG